MQSHLEIFQELMQRAANPFALSRHTQSKRLIQSDDQMYEALFCFQLELILIAFCLTMHSSHAVNTETHKPMLLKQDGGKKVNVIKLRGGDMAHQHFYSID